MHVYVSGLYLLIPNSAPQTHKKYIKWYQTSANDLSVHARKVAPPSRSYRGGTLYMRRTHSASIIQFLSQRTPSVTSTTATSMRTHRGSEQRMCEDSVHVNRWHAISGTRSFRQEYGVDGDPITVPAVTNRKQSSMARAYSIVTSWHMRSARDCHDHDHSHKQRLDDGEATGHEIVTVTTSAAAALRRMSSRTVALQP